MLSFDLRHEQYDTRPLIAVDLDDVVMAFNEALQEWNRVTYGIDYQIEDIVSYNLHELWGCTPDEALERIHAFYCSLQHQRAVPVSGAFEVLQRLKLNYNLVVITGRPDKISPITVDWLEQHFPGMFSAIHFTDRYSHDGILERTTKAEYCKQLGVGLLIDDGLHNALDVVNQTDTDVLLFDRPWNRNPESSTLTRVHSWEETLYQVWLWEARRHLSYTDSAPLAEAYGI